MASDNRIVQSDAEGKDQIAQALRAWLENIESGSAFVTRRQIATAPDGSKREVVTVHIEQGLLRAQFDISPIVVAPAGSIPPLRTVP